LCRDWFSVLIDIAMIVNVLTILLKCQRDWWHYLMLYDDIKILYNIFLLCFYLDILAIVFNLFITCMHIINDSNWHGTIWRTTHNVFILYFWHFIILVHHDVLYWLYTLWFFSSVCLKFYLSQDCYVFVEIVLCEQ
jgi:hypothetical protein